MGSVCARRGTWKYLGALSLALASSCEGESVRRSPATGHGTGGSGHGGSSAGGASATAGDGNGGSAGTAGANARGGSASGAAGDGGAPGEAGAGMGGTPNDGGVAGEAGAGMGGTPNDGECVDFGRGLGVDVSKGLFGVEPSTLSCGCDGAWIDCRVPFEAFCPTPDAFGCPATLANARRNYGAICGAVSYTECPDGSTRLDWTDAETSLTFDSATGRLLAGHLEGPFEHSCEPVVASDDSPLFYSVGPEGEGRLYSDEGCSMCWANAVRSFPRCALDRDGRLSLP